MIEARANVLRTVGDPGLFALKMVFRLQGAEQVAMDLPASVDGGPVDVADMLKYAEHAGFSARCISTTWSELPRYHLPAIAQLHGGSFAILGRVEGDKAVVLRAEASRPTVMSRTEFTDLWEGRLILIGEPAVASRPSRLRRALAAIPHRRREVIAWLRSLPTPGTAGSTGLLASANRGALVLSGQAQKVSGAIGRLALRDAKTPAHELAFLPAALEIVETPPSPIGRAIVLTIVGVFSFGLIWAAVGTIDIVATAPGKFIPSGRTKSIQPLEAGVVRTINVTDGQAVKNGDVLISLDSTMSAAELEHLKSDLMGARLDVARLTAALSRKPDVLAAFVPPDQAPPPLIEMHRRYLASLVAEQSAKLASINSQITQKEAERTTSKALGEKLRSVIAPLQQRVEIREQLYQKGLGSKLSYLTELQDLVSQQKELSVLDSRHAEAEAAITVLVEMRTKAIAEHERTLFDDLAKAEQKVAGLSQDVIKAERRTFLQTLTAPIDGTVQQLAIHTVGGVVTPAQPLMLIVPADSKLEIEAIISNRDIGFIEPGQDATIKVDTFTYSRYGLLNGKILSISKDAITRTKPVAKGDEPSLSASASSSEPSGQELVYSARVSVDRTEMQIDNKVIPLTPGMAATVEIKTGSRSMISYLLSPLLRYQHESLRER